MKHKLLTLVATALMLSSVSANADCGQIANLDRVAQSYLTYLVSDLTPAQEVQMRNQVFTQTMALNFSDRGRPNSAILARDVERGALAVQCVSDRVAELCAASRACAGNVGTSAVTEDLDPELYDPSAVYEMVVDPTTIRVLDRSQAFLEMAIGRLSQRQENSNSGSRITQMVVVDSVLVFGYIAVSRSWVARRMPMQSRLSRVFVVRGLMRSIVRRPGAWAASTVIGTAALAAYEDFMSRAEYETIRRELTMYFQSRSRLQAPGYVAPSAETRRP